ncbi:hypothetical protein QAD02_002030 [Eretmocerus hayati]|uniref:Uncharacterized protein n=1 Tax=Eretmocerus hayati TaxID=131215 RepID=A0ACC2NIM8_9HYME|nr:hypothetical protein QAD02_002030 [Eretmocerus hayati]
MATEFADSQNAMSYPNDLQRTLSQSASDGGKSQRESLSRQTSWTTVLSAKKVVTLPAGKYPSLYSIVFSELCTSLVMVHYCVVPVCSNRSRRKKYTVFSAPKDPLPREEWRRILNLESLEASHKVCPDHFKSEDVKWFAEYFDSLGNCIRKERLKRPRLSQTAVPIAATNDDINSQHVAEIAIVDLSSDANDHCDHSYYKQVLKELSVDDAEYSSLPKHPEYNSVTNTVEALSVDDAERLSLPKYPVHSTVNHSIIENSSASHSSTPVDLKNVQEAGENPQYDLPSQKKHVSVMSNVPDVVFNKEVEIHEINLTSPCAEYYNFQQNSQNHLHEDFVMSNEVPMFQDYSPSGENEEWNSHLHQFYDTLHDETKTNVHGTS